MNAPLRPIVDGDVERLKALCIFIACNVLCYGIHVALFVSAMSVLARRSRMGSFVPIITTTIFLLATAWLISTFNYTLIRVPVPPRPEDAALAMRLNKTDLTLSRINVRRVLCPMESGLTLEQAILSDLIVVWRAWALWPESVFVKSLLAFCMAGTVAGTLGDIVLVHMGGSTRSMQLARLLLSILPILLTNIVATVVVSVKVWEYRRTIRDYLAQPTSTPIENVLLLIVESGGLYIAIWVIFLLLCLSDLPAAFGAGGPTSPAYLMGSIIPSLSGIYPTAIIIITAMQTSPEASLATIDLQAVTIEFSRPPELQTTPQEEDCIPLETMPPGAGRRRSSSVSAKAASDRYSLS
ncbi:uncharacterized protein SCHCODRAFT_02123167 [Schizophyllum commune H4-8]|uniref:uncharacterized protein n=1 Tax=Schizophyllum commune (strain H4-8 / FGSC 9210) TaxID=578458 RepID=UPI002160D6EA|nr:uncharacterized protein SCHCODRAFT_02123167 [Schizophyllum commune H4-8]KAI5885242.1 hypothetical protein SCHCODRAFT_02123167 [Schizophyllum commune H4-8]